MKRTAIVFIDDLSGDEIPEAGHRSTTLALDNQVVVLDLSPDNKADLEAVLAPYLQAGRRVQAQPGTKVTKLTELPTKRRRRTKAEMKAAREEATV